MTNNFIAMKMMAVILSVLIMASIGAGQSYWKRAYGGTNPDEAYAITPTPDGNFIIAGWTSSFSGSPDVYLLKIKPDGDTIWTKTYGGLGIDWAYAITPTPDGNLIVAGGTTSFGTGTWEVYLLKIKPNGDTIWTKTYEANTDIAYAITPTLDGNFIIAGTTPGSIPGNNLHDVFLLKITPNGDTLWTKTYGGTPDIGAYAFAPTSDGNFIVAGDTYSPSLEGAYLMKIKPNGDTIWTKTYAGTIGNVITAISPTPDGNFIAAGYMNLSVNGGYGGFGNIYLLKIKPNGDTIWTKTYGGMFPNQAHAITPTSDGNFLIAGHVDYNVNGDAYLLKIKPNGDSLWTETLWGTNALTLAPTSDGNFIVAGVGNINSVGTGLDVLILSIIDDRYAYKNTAFTFNIPGFSYPLMYSYTPVKTPQGMTVSRDGTISWTPQTDSVYMEHVVYVVSHGINPIDIDTLSFNLFVNSKDHPSKVINPTSSLSNQSHQSGISIFSSSSYITFTLPTPTTGSLAIYDIHGRLVEKLSVVNNTAIWQPKNASGRYFARVISGKQSLVKPFVVVR